MSLISNYPGGFANGVTVREMPVLNTHGGKVFWVSSVEGSDGNPGTHVRPFATLNKAVSFCRASKGDIIMLMPGHAENVTGATSQVIDKAGVQVIGLGSGDLRPTFTYTAAAGSFEIDAANVLIQNVKFLAGVEVTVGVNVDASGVTLRGCEWDWDADSDAFTIGVDVDAVHHVTIESCTFIGDTADTDTGDLSAIRIDAANHVKIVGNYIFGQFPNACISNDSDAAACLDLMIAHNTAYNADSDSGIGNVIDLHNACTGVIAYNNLGGLASDSVASLLDPGSCLCIENYAVNAIDESAVKVPLTAST